MFGPSSLWKQGACHVSGRSSRREIEAELDRESVARTLFSSQSRGRRDLNFACVERRKFDLAFQGEKQAQQKLYRAQAEIEAKNWEQRNRDRSFQEINQEFASLRFRRKSSEPMGRPCSKRYN